MLKMCLAAVVVWLMASGTALAGADCDSAKQPFELDSPAIHGSVWHDLHSQKPRRSAAIELSLSGKIIWTGKTNQSGDFIIDKLEPGLFLLTIQDWGQRGVRLVARRGFSNGQTPTWRVMLYGRGKGCVYVSGSLN